MEVGAALPKAACSALFSSEANGTKSGKVNQPAQGEHRAHPATAWAQLIPQTRTQHGRNKFPHTQSPHATLPTRNIVRLVRYNQIFPRLLVLDTELLVLCLLRCPASCLDVLIDVTFRKLFRTVVGPPAGIDCSSGWHVILHLCLRDESMLQCRTRSCR